MITIPMHNCSNFVRVIIYYHNEQDAIFIQNKKSRRLFTFKHLLLSLNYSVKAR